MLDALFFKARKIAIPFAIELGHQFENTLMLRFSEQPCLQYLWDNHLLICSMCRQAEYVLKYVRTQGLVLVLIFKCYREDL